MSDIIEELGRLADLLDRGVLTPEEFAHQKARLLGTPVPAAVVAPSPAEPEASASPNPAPAATPVPPPTPAAEIPPPPPPSPPAAPAFVPPPAFAPLPPLGGDEHDQMLRAYVGPNEEYYLRKWGEMGPTGNGVSWNFAAFFLSIFWLFYRRMINFGLIGLGALFVLVLISFFSRSLALNALINLLEIGVAVGVGLMGNGWYRRQAEATAALAQASTPVHEERLAVMRARGGVSLPLALGVAAGWLVLVSAIAVVMTLNAFRASSFRSYGSSSYPSSMNSTASADSSTLTLPSSSGIDESWLVGQWENTAMSPCTQWLRFGADHTLGDNANGSGTWSLAAGPGDAYTLSMNITGDGLRQGVLTRDTMAGTMTMGQSPNTITWRKTTC